MAGALVGGSAFADHLNVETDGIWNRGAAVIVPSVLIDQPGIRCDPCRPRRPGGRAGSIGHTYVQAGTSTNVHITTDYPLAPGEDFILMLHHDTDNDGVYSFGEGNTDVDTPALNAEEAPYVQPFIGGAGDMNGAM